jgi:hypothetical protein
VKKFGGLFLVLVSTSTRLPVKMSSLAVVATSERCEHYQAKDSTLASIKREKIFEIFAESSTQAAVRQLDFNEWHLTELWQR